MNGSTTAVLDGTWRLVGVELPPGTIPSADDASRGRGTPRVALVIAPAREAPERWELVVDAGGVRGSFDVVVRTNATPVVVRVDDPNEGRPTAEAADLDYRARDFDALRAAMLRRIEDAAPTGADTTPVPQTTAVVEVLAFLADGLSYAQDAIATEAYLATARRRISATRHAALLDYHVGRGSTARTWVRVDVEGNAPVVLPKGTQLLTRTPRLPVRLLDPADVGRAQAAGALVFETVADATLRPERAPVPLDALTHAGGSLERNATRARVAAEDVPARAGDLVCIESAQPPVECHVVRLTAVRRTGLGTEVEWGDEDGVPPGFAPGRALCLRACNLVLADHGRTLDWERLTPPVRGEAYWPALPARHTIFAVPHDDDGAVAAAALLDPPGDAEAALVLEERFAGARRRWRARPSLLDSHPGARDVVVEVEDDGSARLRFGDGTAGARPRPGAELWVRQRVGRGAEGNVPAGAIAHVLAPEAELPIVRVENVVAARGGSDPEPLSSIRVFAPRADLVDERVVTRADFRAAALAVPGVTDAEVEVASTGRATRVVVHVDTGWPQSGATVAAARASLTPGVLIGTELEVRPAVALGIEVDVEVRLGRHVRRAAAEARLDRALGELGGRGFGRSLSRSDLTAIAARVEGVEDARVTGLRLAGSDRERASIVPRSGEIVRVAGEAPGRRKRIAYTFTGGTA